MKCLGINDIHFTERPPSSCTETYLDDLFDLLEHARRLGEVAKIDCEVWAGDTFHYKAPTRTSHSLVARVADVIRARTWPVFIVLGNHDIQNDRTDSVDKQPIGMLLRAGARLLDGWADRMFQSEEHHEYGMLPLYGVPWIQGYADKRTTEEELDAKVWEAMADWRAQVLEYGTGEHRPLLVTHAPLYPPSRELEFEFYPAQKWANAMRVGACAYGHVHEAHGVWEMATRWETEQTIENGIVTFCNVGALSRGSLHESELQREVAVWLYDSRAGAFKRVALPQKPASEVFRLVEAGERRDAQQSLDDFLAAVGSSTLQVTTADAVVARIQAMDMPRRDEIVSLSRRLMDEVR